MARAVVGGDPQEVSTSTLRYCQSRDWPRIMCWVDMGRGIRAIGLQIRRWVVWGEVWSCVGHGPLSVDGCPPTGGDHILSWICMSRCPLLGGGYLFGGSLLTCWVNIEVSECMFDTLALVANLPMLYWRKVPNMRCHISPRVLNMH